MNTKYFITVWAIVIAIGLYSCQKEFSFEIPPTTVDSIPVAADSNYLSFFSQIDNTGLDSLTFSFLYDQRKRVVMVIEDYGPPSIDSDTTLFFYNGNDTLPYKYTESIGGFGLWFYYDNAGRLLKDSLSSQDYRIVNSYTYGNNEITSTTIGNNFLSSNQYETRDTVQLDAAGNYLNTVSYIKDSASCNFILGYRSVSTFDNKKNPFSKVPAARLLFEVSQKNFESAHAFKGNNELTLVYTEYDLNGVASSVAINYSNTYLQNGFLSQSIDDRNFGKIKYYYKTL